MRAIKTNKEKMISLFTACLNNKSFYDSFYKTEKNPQEEKITMGHHTKPTIKKEQHRDPSGYLTPIYDYEKEGYLPVIENSYYTTEQEYIDYLSINFSDSPALTLLIIEELVDTIESEKIEVVCIKTFKGFWSCLKLFNPNYGDKIQKLYTTKHTHVFNPHYQLSHGLIREKLTLEEGKVFVEMYLNKKKEIFEGIDSDKLNNRIKQYVK